MAGGGNANGMGATGSSAGGSNAALSAGIGGQAAQSAQTPQWLKGLQLGTQLAQMGQRQRPQMPMMQPRPMMQGAPMGGMPQQPVVPGSVPQQPMMPPGMSSGGMGMQQPGMPGQQGQPQINPQLLQMLMRSRGM